MSDNSTDNKTSRSHPRPFWWPEGVPIDQLPGSLPAAIEGIIQPASRNWSWPHGPDWRRARA